MIGRLRGTLLEKQPPFLILDVHGVGYELEAPMSTFYDLPAVGQEVLLHTHLAVKEDAHNLFGFGSKLERSLFRSLIRISGIGPKLALALLSGMRPEELIDCIENQDSAQLTRLPGVGRKTAERLVIEMKDRVADFHTIPGSGPRAPAAGGGSRRCGLRRHQRPGGPGLQARRGRPPGAAVPDRRAAQRADYSSGLAASCPLGGCRIGGSKQGSGNAGTGLRSP